MDAFRFAPITNERDFDNLVKSLHDPDADRFRYFGAAMMSIFNEAPSEQARTLQGLIAEHTPITLDDMRACIDAAMILTPP